MSKTRGKRGKFKEDMQGKFFFSTQVEVDLRVVFKKLLCRYLNMEVNGSCVNKRNWFNLTICFS